MMLPCTIILSRSPINARKLLLFHHESKKIRYNAVVLRAIDYKQYYRILEVEPGASREEIRAAYRKVMLRMHPDRNRDKDTTVEAAAVNEAASILLSVDRSSLLEPEPDVFDAPEGEATEMFVNPFDTCNPMLYEEIIALIQNTPGDPIDALLSAGGCSREIPLYYLTPLQFETLMEELRSMGPAPSAIELEVAEYFFLDALLRAQRANNTMPTT